MTPYTTILRQLGRNLHIGLVLTVFFYSTPNMGDEGAIVVGEYSDKNYAEEVAVFLKSQHVMREIHCFTMIEIYVMSRDYGQARKLLFDDKNTPNTGNDNNLEWVKIFGAQYVKTGLDRYRSLIDLLTQSNIDYKVNFPKTYNVSVKRKDFDESVKLISHSKFNRGSRIEYLQKMKKRQYPPRPSTKTPTNKASQKTTHEDDIPVGTIEEGEWD